MLMNLFPWAHPSVLMFLKKARKLGLTLDQVIALLETKEDSSL